MLRQEQNMQHLRQKIHKKTNNNVYHKTKAELVTSICARTGMSREMALDALEASMASIKESILKGEEVTLRGFGTFGLKERKGRLARNIAKNTTVIVPAHKVVSFKPAAGLEEEVVKI